MPRWRAPSRVHVGMRVQLRIPIASPHTTWIQAGATGVVVGGNAKTRQVSIELDAPRTVVTVPWAWVEEEPEPAATPDPPATPPDSNGRPRGAPVGSAPELRQTREGAPRTVGRPAHRFAAEPREVPTAVDVEPDWKDDRPAAQRVGASQRRPVDGGRPPLHIHE